MLVLFGASQSFLTPMGYQTNLMVYGPGRYRFFDIAKYGAGLTLIMSFTVPALIILNYGNIVKFTSNVYKLKDAYRKLSVPQFTIVTGLFIIFFGTLILSSLYVHLQRLVCGKHFLHLLRITVTGLTIIDIGVDLNLFGQVFLAFMLLSGGLGLMAITTFLQGLL